MVLLTDSGMNRIGIRHHAVVRRLMPSGRYAPRPLGGYYPDLLEEQIVIDREDLRLLLTKVNER